MWESVSEVYLKENEWMKRWRIINYWPSWSWYECFWKCQILNCIIVALLNFHLPPPPILRQAWPPPAISSVIAVKIFPLRKRFSMGTKRMEINSRFHSQIIFGSEIESRFHSQIISNLPPQWHLKSRPKGLDGMRWREQYLRWPPFKAR